jgi:imidazolonepropionase-like amidohydrolase
MVCVNNVFDGVSETLLKNANVLVGGNLIKAVSTKPITAQGATQIKVLAGGGVSSPYDPLDVNQFTFDELKAAVEAASDWGTYVTVHVYNSFGIQRAIAAGQSRSK